MNIVLLVTIPVQLNHRMGFVGEGRLEMFSTAAGGFVPVCAEEWLSSDESSSSGRGGGQQLAEFDWSRNTCRLLGYDQVQVSTPTALPLGGARPLMDDREVSLHIHRPQKPDVLWMACGPY